MRRAILIAAVLLAAGCAGKRNAKTPDVISGAAKQPGQEAAVANHRTPPYTPPKVPAVLTAAPEQAEWLVNHYWDAFDFKDTALIPDEEYMEQAFANFAGVISMAGQYAQEPAPGIRANIAKAEADTAMLRGFMKLYDKYFYDPNSPVRNEDVYIAYLQRIIGSKVLPDIEKERPRYRLATALKNRPGDPAADFAYIDGAGKQSRMSAVKSDLLLLYFHNPGCGGCRELIADVDSSPLISEKIKSGKLKVLAMYVDEDLEDWRAHFSDIPAGWINGADPKGTMRDADIYDLRAIPTIYLLDKEKKVVLKDTTFGELERYLAGRP